jgi:MFS family permease
MGWVNLVGAGAPVFGLAVGGLMVDTIGWRPLFIIQAVLSVLSLGFATLVLRETRRQQGASLDVPGAATLAVAASALVFGVNRLPLWGATHPGVLGPLAVVPLLLFVRAERRATHPLLPLDFFTRRNFVCPMISGFFMNFAYMGGFIITPLLLLQVFLYSATTTSFLTMMRPLTFSLSSPVSGAIATRVGERTMAVTGNGLVVVAMLSFAVGAETASMWFIGGGLMIAGLGLGVSQPSLSALVGNSVDEHSFGIATSAISMTSSIGAVAGISVLTAWTAEATTVGIFTESYLLGAVVAGLGFGATFFLQKRASVADEAPPHA